MEHMEAICQDLKVAPGATSSVCPHIQELEIAKYFIVKTMIELSGQIVIFHQPRLP